MSKIRNILAFPVLYDALQAAVEADECRLAFLRQDAKVNDHERVLDIGCGTARVLRFLPNDVHYVGVDVNARYIEQAREEYQGRGEFLVGSYDHPEIDRRAPYDVVLAMFILHHLDDEQAMALCRRARDLLAPSGRFVSIDPCRTSRAGFVERYIMNRDRGAYIRTEEAYRRIVSSVFPRCEATIRNDLLRIPYTHCIIRGIS